MRDAADRVTAYGVEESQASARLNKTTKRLSRMTKRLEELETHIKESHSLLSLTVRRAAQADWIICFFQTGWEHVNNG